LQVVDDGHDAVSGQGLVADERSGEHVGVALPKVEDIAEDSVDRE
jgi:hypothetical protein